METELFVRVILCVILCVLAFNAAVKYKINVSVQTYSVSQVWVNNVLVFSESPNKAHWAIPFNIAGMT